MEKQKRYGKDFKIQAAELVLKQGNSMVKRPRLPKACVIFSLRKII